MSRNVDLANPDTWEDEDLDYIRERIDQVPVEYRDRVQVEPALAPQPEAQHPELVKLDNWLRNNYPEDMMPGKSPVDVAIELLSEDVPETSAEEDYDNWKVAELQTEAQRRGIDPSGMRKHDLAAALRNNDAEAKNA